MRGTLSCNFKCLMLIFIHFFIYFIKNCGKTSRHNILWGGMISFDSFGKYKFPTLISQAIFRVFSLIGYTIKSHFSSINYLLFNLHERKYRMDHTKEHTYNVELFFPVRLSLCQCVGVLVVTGTYQKSKSVWLLHTLHQI